MLVLAVPRRTFQCHVPWRPASTECPAPGRPSALVLVPTRELAGQVVDVLVPLAHAVGLKVVAFYGGTPFEKQVRSLRKPIDIVVATPGRLIDLNERSPLDMSGINTL